jgi:putative chitinase
MILTTKLLQKAMPKAPEAWLEVLPGELFSSGIDTLHEVASFLAQVAHESNEFTRLEENLSYSAERLMQVWPKRFASFEFAQRYEHSPTRLANYVYANRIGNGEEASGDGWKFHGRGPIQLTGRRNYTACGEDIGADLIAHPELLLTPHTGIRSALWFWRTMNIDELDDDDDVRAETRKINGGETGLAQRQAYFDRIKEILEQS